MKDLISIIVPFYNSDKTLEDCIKSILNQTIDNYEIILINNNSTDNSKKIALYYTQKYKNIYYYNINKRSVSYARNIGIEKSKGNIISFIDSDDLINNKYLELMYKNINNNDLVICNYTNNKKKLNSKIKKIYKLNKNKTLTSILKDNNIKGYVWNKLFKKDIIKNNNIKFNENLKIGEDIEFVFNYLNCCENIVYIDSKLYYYNLNNNTVNNKSNYIYALDGWINLFNLYKKINNNKNLDLICYFYLKKYYEIKFYNKDIIKNDKIHFSNYNLCYNLKIFIYKYCTFIIIILKKLKIILLNRI